MNALRKGLLPLLLLGVMFAQSCKEDSTGPNTGGKDTLTTIRPAAGSTYTYDRTSTQDGQQVNATTNTYTVIALDEEYGGRTGVHLFQASIGDTADKYVYYESNGNVSVPAPSIDFGLGTAEIKWMTLPLIGSGGTTGLVVMDGNFLGVDVDVRVSTSFVAQENLTINGTQYKAKKIKVTTNGVFDFGAGPVTGSDDDYLWWIPELGFLGRSEEGGGADPTTGETDLLHVDVLSAFDLK